jgi:glutathionyl-hydroquinone reductase
MEEKSLPLIQKSQSNSEILEQIRSAINSTILEQNQQVEQLQLKIDQLEQSIKHEINREISCQSILISSEYKNSKTDSLIEQMKKTIEILYKKYLISDDIDISSVHMLQLLENRVKYFFNQIETMDSYLIIEAEKVSINQK